MKRKTIAWILLLCLVVTAFAGCGPKGPNKDTAKEQDGDRKTVEESSKKMTKDKEEEQENNKKNNKKTGNPKQFDKKKAKQENNRKQEEEQEAGDERPEEGRDDQKQTKTPEKKEPKVDAFAAYRKILTRFYDLLDKEGSDDNPKEGEDGFREGIEHFLLKNEGSMFEAFGYLIRDYSGDGVPELVVGNMTGNVSRTRGTKIYALYTLANGKPKLILESIPGYECFLAEDGKIYEKGGYREMLPYFGLFKMSKNAIDREYLDYYFALPKDSNIENIGFYRNKNGLQDVERSEELPGVQGDEIGLYMEKLEKEVYLESLFPFSAYDVTEGKTYGVWGYFMDRETATLVSYHEFVADTTEPNVDLLLCASKPVKNFKILALEHHVNEQGLLIYTGEEIYSQKVLEPRTPFLLTLTFYGLYATYGMSYEEDGVEKRYTLEMSNKDGAFYFVPF